MKKINLPSPEEAKKLIAMRPKQRGRLICQPPIEIFNLRWELVFHPNSIAQRGFAILRHRHIELRCKRRRLLGFKG